MASQYVNRRKSLPRQYAGLIILCVISILLVALYWKWDGVIQSVVILQKQLHTMLVEHIRSVSKNTDDFGSSLMALSFGYGVFHAIGPGHGKAIIVTYLTTHKEKVTTGVVMSFSAALIQALVAIVLVSLLSDVLDYQFSEVRHYGNGVALASYVLVIILGVMLSLSTGYRLVKATLSQRSEQQKISIHQHQHQHQHHHGSCGCSHGYVPDKNKSLWEAFLVVLSMGIRPCSGAIVVLIYAHLVGVYFFGIMATLLMGFGTGLSVCMLAIIAQYGRSWLEKMLIKEDEESWYSRWPFTEYVRLLGGVILILLGWSFYSAALKVVANHPLL